MKRDLIFWIVVSYLMLVAITPSVPGSTGIRCAVSGEYCQGSPELADLNR